MARTRYVPLNPSHFLRGNFGWVGVLGSAIGACSLGVPIVYIRIIGCSYFYSVVLSCTSRRDADICQCRSYLFQSFHQSSSHDCGPANGVCVSISRNLALIGMLRMGEVTY
jgi:hypothetical protein